MWSLLAILSDSAMLYTPKKFSHFVLYTSQVEFYNVMRIKEVLGIYMYIMFAYSSKRQNDQTPKSLFLFQGRKVKIRNCRT